MNKVFLIGHLGADPDVREIKKGVKVAQFSLATTEHWKDRETNERKSATEWHRVVAWRGLAHITENYMKKGSHISIVGKITTRSWEDDNGLKRYVTEIVADEILLLDKKGDRQSSFPPHIADSIDKEENKKTENSADTVEKTKEEGDLKDNKQPLTAEMGETDDLPF